MLHVAVLGCAAWPGAQAQKQPDVFEPAASWTMPVNPEKGELSLDEPWLSLRLPCPPSTTGEIVVCGRPARRSPYRLSPDTADQQGQIGVENRAWGATAFDLVDENRPINSNSPVGSAGQTGWRSEMLRDWAEAQREIARQKEREQNR